MTLKNVSMTRSVIKQTTRSKPCRNYSTTLASSTSAIPQITRLARLGRIELARKVFDELPYRTTIAWNAIIAGYFQNEKTREAQKLFDKMPERNLVSWNALISGYVKNGMVSTARKVFNEMPERNVVSWTAMVGGYLREKRVEEAERLFWEMPRKNVVSWTVMLQGLIEDGRIEDAKRMFGLMPVKDAFARTSMIAGLCAEGQLSEAREIFDGMEERNVVTWTAMVSGYAMNGKVDLARKLFEVMAERNEVTWTVMLMGYTRSGRIKEAEEIFEMMPVKSVAACNEMIIGFGQIGEVMKARSVFDWMTKRDDRTWSAMTKVYARKGFELEALSLFRLMQRQGARPDCPSLISVLNVCGSLSSRDHGRQVHAHLLRCQFDMDEYVSSVLITMYFRCGDLVKGKCVFDWVDHKDIVMWNSITTGYAQHGLGDDALHVFFDMLHSGVAPDEVTFIGVLSACGHSGKVNEGIEIFESMKSKYQVNPGTEHYACMVDLLGRAGRLNEALSLIQKMTVEADAIVWGALLGACRTHMKLDLAEIAVKELVQLEPENAGPYILLSNIYASQGRWNDVAELRETMEGRNVSKSPGCSWIEVDKKVHMFTGGDGTGHPEHATILKMLEWIVKGDWIFS